MWWRGHQNFKNNYEASIIKSLTGEKKMGWGIKDNRINRPTEKKPKMSPDIAKFPLEGKTAPGWDHWLMIMKFQTEGWEDSHY